MYFYKDSNFNSVTLEVIVHQCEIELQNFKFNFNLDLITDIENLNILE